MSETTNEQIDVEPEEPSDKQLAEVVKQKSGRRSFSKLSREISEKELASPAIQKMLVDEIERLEGMCANLSSYSNKFHEADKRLAICEEKFKGKISIEILHVACITIGAAALGYAPSVWIVQPTASILVAFGVILIIAGLAAKAVKL